MGKGPRLSKTPLDGSNGNDESMKQCPECNEVFDDHQAFCDQDGTPLSDQQDLLGASLAQAVTRESKKNQAATAWALGIGGVFVGIMLCTLLYALVLAPAQKLDSRKDSPQPQNRDNNPARSAQLAAAPAQSVTPLPQASPMESPEEDAAQDAAANTSPTPPSSTPAPPTLNEGPISTGEKRAAESTRTVIRMKDGSSVEADAAWEDSQGIWYRRGGLVSFVDRSRVDKITDVSQAQPPSKTQTP